MAIFPANRPELVQGLIDKLSDDFDPDKPIVVEALREDKGKRIVQCSQKINILVAYWWS